MPQGEKYLVLKKKYRQPSLDFSTFLQVGSPLASPDLAAPVSPDPPPYRSPPPASLSPLSQVSLEEAASSTSAREEDEPRDDNSDAASSPPVPPRRKSQDKLRSSENKEMIDKMSAAMLEVAIKVRLFFSCPLPSRFCVRARDATDAPAGKRERYACYRAEAVRRHRFDVFTQASFHDGLVLSRSRCGLRA